MSEDDQTGSPPENAIPPGADALADLAEEYLSLWQSHLQALSADPDVQQTWNEMLKTANASQAAFAAMMGQAASHEPAQRAPSPSPPDGDGGDDLAVVVKRLDDLEKRIAALEGQRSEPPKKTGSTARKRRSS